MQRRAVCNIGFTFCALLACGNSAASPLRRGSILDVPKEVRDYLFLPETARRQQFAVLAAAARRALLCELPLKGNTMEEDLPEGRDRVRRLVIDSPERDRYWKAFFLAVSIVCQQQFGWFDQKTFETELRYGLDRPGVIRGDQWLTEDLQPGEQYLRHTYLPALRKAHGGFSAFYASLAHEEAHRWLHQLRSPACDCDAEADEFTAVVFQLAFMERLGFLDSAVAETWANIFDNARLGLVPFASPSIMQSARPMRRLVLDARATGQELSWSRMAEATTAFHVARCHNDEFGEFVRQVRTNYAALARPAR